MATRPAKRARLLLDNSSSGSESEDVGTPVIKINEEYKKRFEHNKAREERQRLEEKYGKDGAADGSDSDSTSESEDDEGELATHELDTEIVETLKAIRSKDPKIYDKNSAFYTPFEETSIANGGKEEPETKPIHLRDYHRQNLLDGVANGYTDSALEGDAPPIATYSEEQAALKRDLVAQMHAAGGDDPTSDNEMSDDDAAEFLTAKPERIRSNARAANAATSTGPSLVDADADPEGFLSTYVTSRAWVPTPTSRFPAFDSDSESDDLRADAFEEAYNLRFEDPARANAALVSHSRAAAAKFSVRRDEPTGRARGREREKEQKAAEKALRAEEKARLRRLRVDEAQEKLARFREAAGIPEGVAMGGKEWSRFLEGEFKDEDWDKEMASRFGEEYYATRENDGFAPAEGSPDNDEDTERKRKKSSSLKKPKWTDDIDIGDIVPDFDTEEARQRSGITLTDDEAQDDSDTNTAALDGGVPLAPSKPDRSALKRAARLDRSALESLLDSTPLDTSTPNPKSQTRLTDPTTTTSTSTFRYRATSPTTLGLTPLDILMASDSQLNEFAGLKKLAAFRDETRKRKDRKRLGKKARLREWRKGVFGDEGRDGVGLEGWEAWLARAREGGQEGTRGGGGGAGGWEGQGGRRRDGERSTARGEHSGKVDANPNANANTTTDGVVEGERSKKKRRSKKRKADDGNGVAV